MSKRANINNMQILKNPQKTVSEIRISALYAIVIIFVLGFILYSNSFNCSFQFDDETTIVHNDLLQDLSDIKSIWNSYFLKSASTRFVGLYSFALNYHFNQTNVFGYHLINLLIHISSALFVWWLVLLILSTPVLKTKDISRQKELLM